MTTLILAALLLGGGCVYAMTGATVAFLLGNFARRHDGTRHTPAALAVEALFWPVSMVFLVGYFIHATDRRVEKREVTKLLQQEEHRLALESAKDELNQLSVNRRLFPHEEAG